MAKRELSEQELEVLRGFRAEYGDGMAVFNSPAGGLVVIKKPPREEYDRAIAAMAKASSDKRSNGTAVPTAQRTLALACIVYPKDIEERKALLDSFAALPARLADRALELGGSEAEELEGNF